MTSAADMFRNRAKARVGTMVRDKWRLDALLGIGGTAAVYAATHRNGKRVAVKILRSELTSYEEVTTRFAREGYVANKIEHPGVVSVDDDDITEDGAPFLVMELLEGHSLDRYTKGPSTALPLERVIMIVDRVLDVLAKAHAKNVIHRDIKPANIFLARGDEVKVLDFGIARITDALDAGMTQTGTAIGTPGYMAPEQARGRWNDVDGRTDLWAVGATMYALLIGQRPRRAETVQEELLAAMTQPMQPIAQVLGGLPPAIADYIDKAVAFERRDRFPDAATMQAALRDVKVHLYAPPPSLGPGSSLPPRLHDGDLTSASPLLGSSPRQIDYVDEVTVASAPSWQLPTDDPSSATAYPFTLPSQPVAQPVPALPHSRSRLVWLVASVVALAAVLAFALFFRRTGSEGPGPMPQALPVGAQGGVATGGSPLAPLASVPAAFPTEPATAPVVASVSSAATRVPPKDKPKVQIKPPATPRPDSPKEDARCKNPETAPPSCFK